MRRSILGVTLLATTLWTLIPAHASNVLGEGTIWRCHFTFRPEVVGSDGEYRTPSDQAHLYSDPPPQGWQEVEFDDSDWWRQALPLHAGHGGDGFRQSTHLAGVTVRASFGVQDPQRVGPMSLSLRFRGGAVVYLNGTEIARRYLPEGELTGETLATDYPLEAFVGSRGRIPPPHEREDTPEILRRLELRRRTLEVDIPLEALRAGQNVLAIRLHRAATRDGLPSYAGGRASWATVGLLEAELSAASLAEIRPNVQAPRVLQVWNANQLQAITEDLAYGDPFAPLRPVRMVAARNGSASGQVVLSARHGLGGLRGVVGQSLGVQVSPLRHEGGSMLAAPVTVRAAVRPTIPRPGGRGMQAVHYHDILADRPETDSDIQPLWLLVDVPADALPGEYQGMMRIRPGVQPVVDVPVHLTVSPFVLPDPREYVTHMGLLQSPETIAEKYNVPLWSDEHLRLLAPSLDLLGRLGNDTMYVTAVRRTHLGNEHGMIRFRRAGGGRIEPDFSAFEKYLELWNRHVGPPRVMVLYVWEPNMRDGRPLPLTLLDADGEPTAWTGPYYGQSGSEAIWRPVLDGVRERLAAIGWPQDVLMLGCGADTRPDAGTVEFFQRLAPGALWAMFTHGRGDPRVQDGRLNINGMEVGYAEYPDVPRVRFPLRGALIGGWNEEFLRPTSMRGYWSPYSELGSWRTVASAATRQGRAGLARGGADFWRIDGTTDERGHGLLSRYRTNNVLDINLMRDNPRAILGPGADGAVQTVRYRMLLEGLQENEARIFVEQALAEPAFRERLGEELVARCREVLEDRLQAELLGSISWPWFASSGWRDRTVRLYNTAADVARVLE